VADFFFDLNDEYGSALEQEYFEGGVDGMVLGCGLALRRGTLS